jgi:hypothetical protein
MVYFTASQLALLRQAAQVDGNIVTDDPAVIADCEVLAKCAYMRHTARGYRLTHTGYRLVDMIEQQEKLQGDRAKRSGR